MGKKVLKLVFSTKEKDGIRIKKIKIRKKKDYFFETYLFQVKR